MTWTIGTASGDITAEAHVGDLYTKRIGDEVTATFRFHNGGDSDPQTRWASLEPYVTLASKTTIRAGRTTAGEGYFREDTSQLPISSFLVSIEAPVELDHASMWAVIVGGADVSTGGVDPQTGRRPVLKWELDLVPLAGLGDYADRTAAQTALEDEVL